MLDLVMAVFLFWRVICGPSIGNTDISLLHMFVRCYLLREHLDCTVSVWWEKVFSSCLLILRLCCTREWNTRCVISTEAESAFSPLALSSQDVISWRKTKQKRNKCILWELGGAWIIYSQKSSTIFAWKRVLLLKVNVSFSACQ